MTELTLAKAQAVVSGVLSFAREKSAPMTVLVLRARGALKAFAAEDGTALRRADIAISKAYGRPGDGCELSRLASQSRTATGISSRPLGWRSAVR
jgi:uncharacterized protein GlcG (DUF336 family)